MSYFSFTTQIMQAQPHIPGYQLIQRLGGGPLTSVYSARDCGDDSVCAVKVIREDWEDPATALKLLQREARAGLSVRHPNLVRVLDAHVTRPPYFLVMEFLPGESLQRRLQRDRRLEAPMALPIVRQAAEALAVLHKAGFLHGDIKPDNIRLGGDGRARLIDLGFAHRPGENAQFFQKGYILGAVDYLAPELCRNDADAGPASDLYSLGVTLFEMLSGRLPYPPGTIEETCRRHCSSPPDDLCRHSGEIPAALVELVESLLALEPNERPRAAAVVQQLYRLESPSLRLRRSA